MNLGLVLLMVGMVFCGVYLCNLIGYNKVGIVSRVN